MYTYIFSRNDRSSVTLTFMDAMSQTQSRTLEEIVLNCANVQIQDSGHTLEIAKDRNTLFLERKRYEFRVAGVHFDTNQLSSYATSIQTLYTTEYPGIHFFVIHNIIYNISLVMFVLSPVMFYVCYDSCLLCFIFVMIYI